MAGWRSLLPLLLPAAALAQFVKTPTDLKTVQGHAGVPVRYKEVPTGICELDPNVKSFSGYADVAEDQHIFFWFFEARNVDPTTAPLTVWINGGPGSSSMIGLFEEHGPCRIDADGSVVNNPYSWNNVSNMLYIDQPTQTGFSYSVAVPAYYDNDGGKVIVLPNNTCPEYAQGFGSCGTYPLPDISLTANSTIAAAPNFWKTIQGFLGAFPQYSNSSFHFASESYGGHYGPIFNDYILEQNANLPEGAVEIPLKSVSIGNGWFDPLIQYQAYYNFTVYPGNTYDYFPYNATQEEQLYLQTYGAGNCVDKLEDCKARGWDSICSEADTFCANEVETFLGRIANRDEYDIREVLPDPFPPTYYREYLNRPAIQEAIGAYINYSSGGDIVWNAFSSTGDDARETGTVAALQRILEKGVRVMLFFGDSDYNCNWLGGEVVAENVQAPGFDTAGYANISFSDGAFNGQVKQSGLFSFVRIFHSGHLVPFYQPLAAIEIFERAITGKDIETGKLDLTADYKTLGPAESTYHEGLDTVQFEVLDPSSTYNTTTHKPNPLSNKTLEERVEDLGERLSLTKRRVTPVSTDRKVRQFPQKPGYRSPRG